MVESGATALEEAHAARGIGSGRGHGRFEIGPADVMRAGAGDEQTAGAQHFERAKVQLLVTAQRALDGAFSFCEGRRIKNDGVKFFTGLRPVAENLEGVGLYPINISGNASAVGLEIALCNFKRGARAVDARDLATDLRKVQGETAQVATDVERTAVSPEALRPLLRRGVVGALIEKGSGFLARVGVVVKDEVV